MCSTIGRRQLLGLAATAGVALGFAPALRAQRPQMLRRSIPRTGETLPVVGLGTSDEFESIPADGGAELLAVVRTLLDQGGTLIDTAPGYGQAEAILGRFLVELDALDRAFVSTKVKQTGVERGLASMERSQERLDKRPLDLMMVHSLEDVYTQVENLKAWKDAGRVRYIGITTYRGSGYDIVEDLIERGGLDFIQIDYSVEQTLAAERVIPAAAAHGVAVMINSAFGNGGYFRRLRGQALPPWAADFGCTSWAQFSLKYILAHPDVTCVLAATSDHEHMRDNAQAGFGPLPDAAQQRAMLDLIRRL